MKIELRRLSVRDITDGYEDNGEEGVVGYGGKLDIRPKYQREFVYKAEQRNAVIQTALRGFPLNTMYWAVSDDGYELLDGQQRTLSICQFVAGDFSVFYEGNPHFFHNLPGEVQKRFCDYELQIYFCDGEDGEKLEWFKTINIAGEKLTDQELRNAVYCGGAWLPDAKRHFSKTGCAAYRIAKDYIGGTAIRQEYLETAIKWHCGGNANSDICAYMNQHRNDANAKSLWAHFNAVVDWIKATFPDTRKTQMQGVDWGALYAAHSGKTQDAAALGGRVKELMSAEAITRKSGIYPFVLDGKRKHLNMRAFPPHIKTAIYEKQDGKCALCGKQMKSESEAHADHIEPWRRDGSTTAENCQILCIACNLRKGGA